MNISTGLAGLTGDGEVPLDMMMMQMTFYVSRKVTVLFEIWDIKTVVGLVLTSLFWSLLAFLYQGLKYLRGYVHKKCQCGAEGGVLGRVLGTGYGAMGESSAHDSNQVNWRLHVTQTFLQMLQTTTSYFLMLVVMTFNVWLFIAIIIGDGVGYLVFQRYSFDNSDHCG